MEICQIGPRSFAALTLEALLRDAFKDFFKKKERKPDILTAIPHSLNSEHFLERQYEEAMLDGHSAICETVQKESLKPSVFLYLHSKNSCTVSNLTHK